MYKQDVIGELLYKGFIVEKGKGSKKQNIFLIKRQTPAVKQGFANKIVFFIYFLSLSIAVFAMFSIT